MFTGIVEELGKVRSISRSAKSSTISISANLVLTDSKIGDSIAVNGTCLTVTKISETLFCADVMNETIKRSSLAQLKTGDTVNLERAMPANGRFGGHMVSGHIDGTGIISAIFEDDNAVWYRILTDESITKFIIEKGSVAVDGISLTVAGVSKDSFEVSVIPHTRENTVLKYKTIGDKVNIETDMIGKYIEKLIFTNQIETKNKETSNITMEFLSKFGF